MKKFISIVLVIILSKLSFVYADSLKPKNGDDVGGVSTVDTASTESIHAPNHLKYLAGKTIHRDVPAQNKTEFSKEYMGEPYELFSYNENIMELKDSNKKSIILGRSLWDDGNWKEYIRFGSSTATWNKSGEAHRFGIGDMVQTTNEYNKNYKTTIIGRVVDIAIAQYPYNEVATLDNGEILDTDWLEKYNLSQTMKKILSTELNPIKKRLICAELIGSETFHMEYGCRSKYSCVDCGHWLKEGAVTNYYYCPMCCEGFCIEEKEAAVLSAKKQDGTVAYEITDFHAVCSSTYLEKYNLRRGDHVVWDKKCGHVLVFDMNNATVAYCRGKSSPYYCTARDEVEYIGANNLTKSGKCFKYPQ